MASHSMKQPECALSILITLLFPSLSFSDAESGSLVRESERERKSSDSLQRAAVLVTVFFIPTENSRYSSLEYISILFYDKASFISE